MARSIQFDGIREGSYVTFKSSLAKHTDEDKLVIISADDTVAVCANGEAFHGIVRVIDQKDKAASVQVDGFVTMLWDTLEPTLGYCTLVASGVGGKTVKKVAAADGKGVYLVVSTSATHVTFLLAA